MSTAADLLDEINRIHDRDPERAAVALRQLDVAGLRDDQLRLAAFLVNHLLGEQLGRWAEAAERAEALATRAGPSTAVLRQAAVAAHLAGEPTRADVALRRLCAAAAVDAQSAALAVRVAALAFRRSVPAAELAMLAQQSAALAPSALDEGLAAAFNNGTTGLYYASRQQPLTAALSQALTRGAAAALLFWLRAGGWMQHERAYYLQAKIALRTGDLALAALALERGLAIVAEHGDDPVERAFLLQLRCALLERTQQRERASLLRAEVAALARTFDADLQKLLADDGAEFPPPPAPARVAFIGGGNLASALIGGLRRENALAGLHVVELDADKRAQFERDGATTAAQPDAQLATVDVIVLAVKPQQMREVCAAIAPHAGHALLLSVAAGIRAADIARWCGTRQVVRAMPNTPALIGAGISGVAALPDVGADRRALAERILATAGPVVWVDDEALLDPVTAVSGSGPAYVFRFIEALHQAGRTLGLGDAQARQLAIATFTGAAQLAAQSDEPLSVLRERVTSKGGTTAAALAVMAAAGLGDTIVAAARAADARAREMGDEFGRL